MKINTLRNIHKFFNQYTVAFDIDDTVYYMEKVSDISGHSGYKIIKTKWIFRKS